MQSWLHPSLVSSFVANHAQELENICSNSRVPCVRFQQLMQAQQLMQWQNVWKQSDKKRYERRPAPYSGVPADDLDHHVANILITLARSSHTANEEVPLPAVTNKMDSTHQDYQDAQLLFSLEL